MPLIEVSSYKKRPWFLFNNHLETIYPSIFLEKKHTTSYQRERLELKDGDFVDLDWKQNNNKRLILFSHGLEGSSERYYIKRAVNYFSDLNWDCLAWNCRSCSGEINRLPRLYHHGDINDFTEVVDYVLKNNDYETILFVGYSMGGNKILKYLGSHSKIDTKIKGSVVFSVPCNLEDSINELKKFRLYEKKFVGKIKNKLIQKSSIYPSEFNINWIEKIDDFESLMKKYLIPFHNFETKYDFFNASNCHRFIPDINVPTLIVNAWNDPMLVNDCYPIKLAKSLENIFLEIPKIGGHVGFTLKNKPYSWMELRLQYFIDTILTQSTE